MLGGVTSVAHFLAQKSATRQQKKQQTAFWRVTLPIVIIPYRDRHARRGQLMLEVVSLIFSLKI